MYDVVIIGAGMSGLAAGIRLAYFERRVCLVEQHTTIGGLNSFYRLRGRNFDVGLHAITNMASPTCRSAPLSRLLRQLRFHWDDWQLSPQWESLVVFPQAQLRFNNDPQLLFSEIARLFPDQQDRVMSLVNQLLDYHQLDSAEYCLSARRRLEELISEPLLREMLLCPVMWYGNARQDDMEWGQFSILFRSIFLEGLGRPAEGIRLILRLLAKRYRALGGQLRLRAAVKRIVIDKGTAVGVELADGEVLPARQILSSAGWCETLQLCGICPPADHIQGRLSFVESICLLDRPSRQWGHPHTMVFFNDGLQFHWQNPHGKLCDLRTGVICASDNFCYPVSQQENVIPTVRVTVLADHAGWKSLPAEQYQQEKHRWFEQILATATRWIPDFRPYITETDIFTPRTIEHYTWHVGGAVYGSPFKQRDGRTPIPNVYLCGTDQGLVGIVGAMTSGVTIANRYCLQGS